MAVLNREDLKEFVSAQSADDLLDWMTERWVDKVPTPIWTEQDQAVFEYVAGLIRAAKMQPKADNQVC